MLRACRVWMNVLVGLACAGVISGAARACDVVAVAAEIGLTPESVTVAGFGPGQGMELLLRLDAAEELCSALEGQHAMATSIAAEVTALATLLVTEAGNDEVHGQHESALAALADIRAGIESTRASLRAVALEGAPPLLVERLAAWRSASCHRVPDAFRVIDRTPEQWGAIEVALRASKRAIRRGEPLAPEYAALLSAIQMEPAVTQAQARLDTHLDTMKTVFAAFAGN